ncbi:MAG: NAD(P)H-hydrate dehydratase [Arenicellales bacterium]
MSRAAQRLYTAAGVRELDRVAIEECGIDAWELMRRAGLVGYRLMRHAFPRARRIAVFCGGGNNGGDGYVLAALARERGMEVELVATGQPKSAEARRALAEFRAAGGMVKNGTHEVPAGTEVIVDALLGTGLEKAPAGEYGAAIARINASHRPVIALDIPSGLHADTGTALEPCVRAGATATFIGRKLGCFTGDGRAVVGRLHFDDLGVPGEIYDHVECVATLIDPAPFATFVRARSPVAHKGDAGRVLVVGGNHGMPGAPCMAARAAHRSGAGLVYLATRSKPENLVTNTLESIAYCLESADGLASMMEKADVVAIGPGLGRDPWAGAVWQAVIAGGRPLVVDADALYFLAASPIRREDWVLTPHPGEAAALLGIGTAEVQADRVSAARALRDRYGGVIVLKGPGTLVLGESLHVCDGGNAGMASGGMGDVLTGVIAALRGQGMVAEDAACYGVWCHARAGDLAAPRGLVGLTAGALGDALADVVGAPAA